MARYMILFLPLALLAGCATQPPPRSELAPLQARVVNTRDLGKQFNATYDDIWWATLTVLQNDGFVLRQADKEAGFIYGVWMNTFEQRARKFADVEVSLTLEKREEHSTWVRLSARLGSDGEPQDDGAFTSRFFAGIQKELFLRMAQKRFASGSKSP
jgi:hypothetical protein